MKVTTKKVDMRSLCLEQDPKMYSEREPSYEFDKRKFTKPQKINRATNE